MDDPTPLIGMGIGLASTLAFWIPLCFFLAGLSGWKRFAKHYAVNRPFTGKSFHFQSVQFRGWFGYNGCLSAGADVFGIRLSVWTLFRAGHPPLYVPWKDVSVSFGKVWWIPTAEFRFSGEPSISVLVRRSLAEKLARESSGQFVLPD